MTELLEQILEAAAIAAWRDPEAFRRMGRPSRLGLLVLLVGAFPRLRPRDLPAFNAPGGVS